MGCLVALLKNDSTYTTIIPIPVLSMMERVTSNMSFLRMLLLAAVSFTTITDGTIPIALTAFVCVSENLKLRCANNSSRNGMEITIL